MGRWHKNGQSALYLSGSPEGCRVALKVYLNPNDPPRGIFPLDVTNAKITDYGQAAPAELFPPLCKTFTPFGLTWRKQGNLPPHGISAIKPAT